MLYLLYGENETEIDKFINNLIDSEHIDTKVTYNYKESDIKDVIEEASYLDLFGNKKLIVLNESDFLTSKSVLDDKVFDNYIDKPNLNTILVFKIVTEKLDERKKIVKTLKEKAVVKEFKLLDEKSIPEYVSNYFSNINYKIDKDALYEITDRLKSNPKVIDSELNKLVMFKYNDKHINLNDVNNVISKYESNKIFKLVDAVLKKDKSNIFRLYKELIDDKEEPTVILVMLANQFRLLYQVKILSREGLDKFKIGIKLKENPYRVGIAITNSRMLREEELLKLLSSLADIDYKIKSGLIDKVKALELFFLEL